jgi:hypothetical protein
MLHSITITNYKELAEVVRKHKLTTKQVEECIKGMSNGIPIILNEHPPEELAKLLEIHHEYKTEKPIFLDIDISVKTT